MKITVVGNAPFTIQLETGSVKPGQVVKTERNAAVEQYISEGILAEVAVVEKTTGPVRKVSTDDHDSSKETS